VSRSPDPQAAPGALEEVRQLLNTWLIPNDTREPADELDEYARRRGLSRRQSAELRRLRDDVRTALEDEDDAALDETLNRWIEQTGVEVEVAAGQVRYAHRDTPAGHTVAVILDAIVAAQWPRLKACPDCRWVFYDHTRNGSKRWCLMNAAGSQGRSCGNIAKVRRYRARHTTPPGPAA
jgi:predicted RNA-binding Zn ribbon-like protein